MSERQLCMVCDVCGKGEKSERTTVKSIMERAAQEGDNVLRCSCGGVMQYDAKLTRSEDDTQRMRKG